MTTHDADQVVGYINPDGSDRGNWMTAVDPCPSCGQVHGRIRYQAERNPEGSQLVEIIASLVILSLLIVGLGMWAGILAVAS